MAHVLRSREIQVTKQKTQTVKVNSSYGSTPSAKALRLVYCDESGTFRMDAEAVASLQMVKGPLGVVSVCGRARQGKSFILNQLLGRSSGFQVASTHRPCTKGLWMWSTPLKRTASDGTEYSLLLLDSEGIDAYDQTGTYSTQIFSLAVLLSSLFIYNQMGGIDEAALDGLSLVTEMTKHIRVRASEHRPSSAELGQFSPVFLWLLRDFYLDLSEEGKRISPRDYLESALQPIPGNGKAIAAKNEIRDSIRALFPDRDCFTLVRPQNNENDLQHLDQIPFESLRPEFRAGIEILTKFVFDRTKPKQMGSAIMTGPLLASLTQSFLDALNAGAVPTIATSWQNVEESECRRAHDAALELYTGVFSKSVAKDEEALRTMHESAMIDALSVYNDDAVGAGLARQKYEKLLTVAFKRNYEECMHSITMEAEMNCVKAAEKMDETLWTMSSDTTFDQVLEVLQNLLTEYDQTTYGPAKWKKFKKFLQNSLEGPLKAITKRQNQQSSAERTAVQMKARSLEEKLCNLEQQLDCARQDTGEWKNRYESAVAEVRSSEEAAAARYIALQKTHNALEEKYNVVSHQLESSRKELSDWRTRFEAAVSERQVAEEQLSVELGALQSRYSATEGRLAAAREQLQSAKEEAAEWKRKYGMALEESQTTSERASAMCERTKKGAQDRYDVLRGELLSSIAAKEREIKEAQSKFEQDERRLAASQTRLEDQELKLNVQEEELVTLRSELKHAKTIIDATKSTTFSYEKELGILKQEQEHLEGKRAAEMKRLEDAEAKARLAEREAKSALERAVKDRHEAAKARKEKLEADRLAAERLAAQESVERQCKALVRERKDLVEKVARLEVEEEDTVSKVRSLDKQLEERDKELGGLLDSAHKQRANTIQVLEGLLASERKVCMEANTRAESLSVQLQLTQGKLDALQQEFSTTRLNETVLDSKLRIRQHGGQLKRPSPGKMPRADNEEESVQDIDVDTGRLGRAKRVHMDNVDTENGVSPGQSQCNASGKSSEDNTTTPTKDLEDYMKFTVPKLKQELTRAGFADELLQYRNPTKKELLGLYERHVLLKGV